VAKSNACTEQSLLADLATVTRNVMAMNGAPEASFVLYPQITPSRTAPSARPRRQSVATPATREFEIR
jgi:hypothetical protein